MEYLLRLMGCGVGHRFIPSSMYQRVSEGFFSETRLPLYIVLGNSGSMKEGPGLLETPALSGLTNTEKLGVTYLLLCGLYEVPEKMINFVSIALR
jgi:hypothetical protein